MIGSGVGAIDDDPGDGVLGRAVCGLDDGLIDLFGILGDLAERVGDLLELSLFHI